METERWFGGGSGAHPISCLAPRRIKVLHKQERKCNFYSQCFGGQLSRWLSRIGCEAFFGPTRKNINNRRSLLATTRLWHFCPSHPMENKPRIVSHTEASSQSKHTRASTHAHSYDYYGSTHMRTHSTKCIYVPPFTLFTQSHTSFPLWEKMQIAHNPNFCTITTWWRCPDNDDDDDILMMTHAGLATKLYRVLPPHNRVSSQYSWPDIMWFLIFLLLVAEEGSSPFKEASLSHGISFLFSYTLWVVFLLFFLFLPLPCYWWCTIYIYYSLMYDEVDDVYCSTISICHYEHYGGRCVGNPKLVHYLVKLDKSDYDTKIHAAR